MGYKWQADRFYDNDPHQVENERNNVCWINATVICIVQCNEKSDLDFPYSAWIYLPGLRPGLFSTFYSVSTKSYRTGGGI